MAGGLRLPVDVIRKNVVQTHLHSAPWLIVRMRLCCTGMHEALQSVVLDLSYARSRAAEFNIDERRFSTHDIHIHIPEGAIPKDGPSAGVTMALAMISALTDTPIRRNVALTGEITLRGNILPVGGVKSKVLAARRAKIDTVLLPRVNGKDVDELPAYVRRDIEFKLMDQVDEVLKAALVDHGKIFRIADTPTRIPRHASPSQAAGTVVT